MLLLFGNGEKVEDHEKEEQIIDAERELQNIAGDELQRDLVSLPEIQNAGEPGSQADIDGAPSQRLAKAGDRPGR